MVAVSGESQRCSRIKSKKEERPNAFCVLILEVIYCNFSSLINMEFKGVDSLLPFEGNATKYIGHILPAYNSRPTRTLILRLKQFSDLGTSEQKPFIIHLYFYLSILMGL